MFPRTQCFECLKGPCSLCRAQMCQPCVESENYFSSSVLRELFMLDFDPTCAQWWPTCRILSLLCYKAASSEVHSMYPSWPAFLTLIPLLGKAIILHLPFLFWDPEITYRHIIRAISSFICTLAPPPFSLVFYIHCIRHLCQILQLCSVGNKYKMSLSVITRSQNRVIYSCSIGSVALF